MTLHAKSEHIQCYACQVDVSGKYRNKSLMDTAFVLYENVVEHIESLPPDTQFNIMGIWRALGRGYQEIHHTRMVIRDMSSHGLIICVHRDKNDKCRSWKVDQ